jgi:hypothetical protein
MPISKRSHEGYLLVDHRASPGVPAHLLPADKQFIGVPEGKVLEAGLLTCAHCQTGMMVNPLRTRDRAYCPKCDHYICDTCEAIRIKAGGACNSFKRLMDDAADAVAKGIPILTGPAPLTLNNEAHHG